MFTQILLRSIVAAFLLTWNVALANSAPCRQGAGFLDELNAYAREHGPIDAGEAGLAFLKRNNIDTDPLARLEKYGKSYCRLHGIILEYDRAAWDAGVVAPFIEYCGQLHDNSLMFDPGMIVSFRKIDRGLPTFKATGPVKFEQSELMNMRRLEYTYRASERGVSEPMFLNRVFADAKYFSKAVRIQEYHHREQHISKELEKEITALLQKQYELEGGGKHLPKGVSVDEATRGIDMQIRTLQALRRKLFPGKNS